MKESKICFEKISAYESVDFNLPQRKTKFSAGYDFEIPEDIVIPSHYKNLFGMVRNRMLLEDFKEEGIKLESYKKAMELQSGTGLKKMINQTQLTNELIDGVSQLTEFISKMFTMDLSTISKLIKENDLGPTLVPTGVKAKFEDNQKLELLIRSSIPLKTYMVMANSVGLIDSDYYNNDDNEGHIFFQVINLSPFDIQLKKGDVIGQGVISEYQKTDNDTSEKIRDGGMGSTTEKLSD